MSNHYATHRVTVGGNAEDVRIEELHGREHVVASATLVKEMVLKGELLPFEEIERTALAWNGEAATIDHPTDEDGNFEPAATPDNVEAHVVGMLFGAGPNDNDRSLDSEVWADRERSAAVADDLDRDDPAELLLAGETIEVSTGYWYRREDVQGTHNGADYTATQRDIQPDHLALLPNATGECSREDGCGAGVGAANADADTDGHAAFAAHDDQQAAHSMITQGLSLLGIGAGCGCEECSADDHGTHTDDPDTADADVTTDGGAESTADNGSGDDTPGSDHMTERIETLAERTAFEADTLAEMADEQLDALEATLEDVSNDDGGDGGDDPPADTDPEANEGTDPDTGGGDDAAGDDTPDADTLADQVADRVLDEVDSRFEQLERERHAEERTQLVDRIATHSSFEADELDAFDLEALETLARDVTPQGGVYAGAAGSSGEPDEVELIIDGYHASEELADADIDVGGD